MSGGSGSYLRASQRERDTAISQREIQFELRPRELVAGGRVPLGGDGDVEREEEVRRRGLRLHLRGRYTREGRVRGLGCLCT